MPAKSAPATMRQAVELGEIIACPWCEASFEVRQWAQWLSEAAPVLSIQPQPSRVVCVDGDGFDVLPNCA